MSDAPLAKPMTFQERMMDRIKASIGELITDDELRKMVQEGVHKAFFDKRETQSSWGHVEFINSWLEEELRKLLNESVRQMVQDEVNLHTKEVLGMVQKIVQEGAGKAIVAALSDRFTGAMMTMKDSIVQQMISH
jgi:hypothetical protein